MPRLGGQIGNVGLRDRFVLERRGLQVQESAMGGSSFHVADPDGFEVQMGGKDQ